MKLYVDDVRKAPEGWTLVRSITDAVRAIDTFEPEEISLDHDKSHYTDSEDFDAPVHPCDECYCPVAYFIKEKYRGREMPPVHVHSDNPDGRKTLKAILGSAP